MAEMGRPGTASPSNSLKSRSHTIVFPRGHFFLIFSVNLFLFLIDDFDYKRNWDDVRKLNLPSLQDKTITRSCILSSPIETVAEAHPPVPAPKWAGQAFGVGGSSAVMMDPRCTVPNKKKIDTMCDEEEHK